MRALLLTLCRANPCTAFLFSARRPGAKAPVPPWVGNEIPAGISAGGERRRARSMTRNGLILYLKAYLQAGRARLQAENETQKAMADYRYEKLKAQRLLPEACGSETAVEFLIDCLKSRRANTLQGAIDLWKCVPAEEDS